MGYSEQCERLVQDARWNSWEGSRESRSSRFDYEGGPLQIFVQYINTSTTPPTLRSPAPLWLCHFHDTFSQQGLSDTAFRDGINTYHKAHQLIVKANDRRGQFGLTQWSDAEVNALIPAVVEEFSSDVVAWVSADHRRFLDSQPGFRRLCVSSNVAEFNRINTRTVEIKWRQHAGARDIARWHAWDPISQGVQGDADACGFLSLAKLLSQFKPNNCGPQSRHQFNEIVACYNKLVREGFQSYGSNVQALRALFNTTMSDNCMGDYWAQTDNIQSVLEHFFSEKKVGGDDGAEYDLEANNNQNVLVPLPLNAQSWRQDDGSGCTRLDSYPRDTRICAPVQINGNHWVLWSSNFEVSGSATLNRAGPKTRQDQGASTKSPDCNTYRGSTQSANNSRLVRTSSTSSNLRGGGSIAAAGGAAAGGTFSGRNYLRYPIMSMGKSGWVTTVRRPTQPAPVATKTPRQYFDAYLGGGQSTNAYDAKEVAGALQYLNDYQTKSSHGQWVKVILIQSLTYLEERNEKRRNFRPSSERREQVQKLVSSGWKYIEEERVSCQRQEAYCQAIGVDHFTAPLNIMNNRHVRALMDRALMDDPALENHIKGVKQRILHNDTMEVKWSNFVCKSLLPTVKMAQTRLNGGLASCINTLEIREGIEKLQREGPLRKQSLATELKNLQGEKNRREHQRRREARQRRWEARQRLLQVQPPSTAVVSTVAANTTVLVPKSTDFSASGFVPGFDLDQIALEVLKPKPGSANVDLKTRLFTQMQQANAYAKIKNGRWGPKSWSIAYWSHHRKRGEQLQRYMVTIAAALEAGPVDFYEKYQAYVNAVSEISQDILSKRSWFGGSEFRKMCIGSVFAAGDNVAGSRDQATTAGAQSLSGDAIKNLQQVYIDNVNRRFQQWNFKGLRGPDVDVGSCFEVSSWPQQLPPAWVAKKTCELFHQFLNQSERTYTPKLMKQITAMRSRLDERFVNTFDDIVYWPALRECCLQKLTTVWAYDSKDYHKNITVLCDQLLPIRRMAAAANRAAGFDREVMGPLLDFLIKLDDDFQKEEDRPSQSIFLFDFSLEKGDLTKLNAILEHPIFAGLDAGSDLRTAQQIRSNEKKRSLNSILQRRVGYLATSLSAGLLMDAAALVRLPIVVVGRESMVTVDGDQAPQPLQVKLAFDHGTGVVEKFPAGYAAIVVESVRNGAKDWANWLKKLSGRHISKQLEIMGKSKQLLETAFDGEQLQLRDLEKIVKGYQDILLDGASCQTDAKDLLLEAYKTVAAKDLLEAYKTVVALNDKLGENKLFLWETLRVDFTSVRKLPPMDKQGLKTLHLLGSLCATPEGVEAVGLVKLQATLNQYAEAIVNGHYDKIYIPGDVSAVVGTYQKLCNKLNDPHKSRLLEKVKVDDWDLKAMRLSDSVKHARFILAYNGFEFGEYLQTDIIIKTCNALEEQFWSVAGQLNLKKKGGAVKKEDLKKLLELHDKFACNAGIRRCKGVSSLALSGWRFHKRPLEASVKLLQATVYAKGEDGVYVDLYTKALRQAVMSACEQGEYSAVRKAVKFNKWLKGAVFFGCRDPFKWVYGTSRKSARLADSTYMFRLTMMLANVWPSHKKIKCKDDILRIVGEFKQAILVKCQRWDVAVGELCAAYKAYTAGVVQDVSFGQGGQSDLDPRHYDFNAHTLDEGRQRLHLARYLFQGGVLGAADLAGVLKKFREAIFQKCEARVDVGVDLGALMRALQEFDRNNQFLPEDKRLLTLSRPDQWNFKACSLEDGIAMLPIAKVLMDGRELTQPQCTTILAHFADKIHMVCQARGADQVFVADAVDAFERLNNSLLAPSKLESIDPNQWPLEALSLRHVDKYAQLVSVLHANDKLSGADLQSLLQVVRAAVLVATGDNIDSASMGRVITAYANLNARLPGVLRLAGLDPAKIDYKVMTFSQRATSLQELSKICQSVDRQKVVSALQQNLPAILHAPAEDDAVDGSTLGTAVAAYNTIASTCGLSGIVELRWDFRSIVNHLPDSKDEYNDFCQTVGASAEKALLEEWAADNTARPELVQAVYNVLTLVCDQHGKVEPSALGAYSLLKLIPDEIREEAFKKILNHFDAMLKKQQIKRSKRRSPTTVCDSSLFSSERQTRLTYSYAKLRGLLTNGLPLTYSFETVTDLFIQIFPNSTTEYFPTSSLVHHEHPQRSRSVSSGLFNKPPSSSTRGFSVASNNPPGR